MNVTLTVAHGPHAGQSYTFREHDNFIVGRASYAHFRLPKKDRYFSRVHFMIEVNPPYCRLMDMGSRNGTYVNDRRVRTVDIHDGDYIKGGNTVIQVSIEGAEHAPRRETIPPASEEKSLSGTAAGLQHRRKAQKPTKRERGEDPAHEATSQAAAVKDGLSESYFMPDVELPAATRALLPDDFVDRINNHRQPVPGYLIVDELGRGGMGVVYRAIDRRDGSIVALKTIRPAEPPSGRCPVDEREISRFLREASILRELDHPHIVAFHELGEAEGRLYFAMEYVSGTDAARLLHDNDGPLDVPRAVGITCQMLAALEYAHERGFVHRDVKPQNMLLTTVEGRGIVKLADFGLAHTYQSSPLSGLTLLEDVRGTSQFISPEQITNYREAKPSTDQYSAAASLYYLLTDKYVYDFPNSINRRFQMILQDDPVPIQDRRPDIPDRLAEIIHRALRRDPDERFHDVGEFRAALLAFLKSGQATERG